MRMLRCLPFLLVVITVLAAPGYARERFVDARLNCIDLTSHACDVSGSAVWFGAYRSVPFQVRAWTDTPPVCNAEGGPLSGLVFSGGLCDAGGARWENRTLGAEDELDIAAGAKNQEFYTYFAENGNLADNAGGLSVEPRPTAWGILPDVPVAQIGSATAVLDGQGRIVLFGGGYAPDRLYDNTWRLDASSTGNWTELSTSGPRPAARAAHSAVYDPNPGGAPRMIIFGGTTGPSIWVNDTWSLNLETLHWEQIPTSNTPPEAYAHRAVYDENNGSPRMLVGGSDCWLGSIYALDLHTNAWTLLTNGGPGRRAGSGICLYTPAGGHPQLLCFGGGHASIYYDDLWSLDLQTLAWTQLPAGDYGTPEPRASMVMEIDPVEETLIMFSGNDAGRYLHDVWIYRLREQTWEPYGPTCELPNWPAPTAGAASVYDVAYQALVVIGGAEGRGYVPAVRVNVLDPALVWTSGIGQEVKANATPAMRIWPVPSHGRTDVEYALPAGGSVEAWMVDVHGRVVYTVPPTTAGAGNNHFGWNGVMDNGQPAPAGVYFCKVAAAGSLLSARLTLVR